MDTIAEQIRLTRRQQGLTMRALSERAGVHYATLSRIERGRRVGATRSLDRIGVALGIMITLGSEGEEERKHVGVE